MRPSGPSTSSIGHCLAPPTKAEYFLSESPSRASLTITSWHQLSPQS